MKVAVLIALFCLPACSWIGSQQRAVPDPTELVITGAAVGSIVLVDGVQIGQEPTLDTHALTCRVSPGPHVVEVHLGNAIVYREETSVARGEHRAVTVLSGSAR